MKKGIYAGFILCSIVIIAYSCSRSSGSTTNNGGGGTTTDCSTTSAKFAADVSPIISTSCAVSGCHNGTQAPALLTYA
ncbi:MAG: hypothetical protein HYX40_08075 [Sphingobacteriales bacterium]|nr:hypothetical protein [Sphingobacteriales bacterium]